MLIFLSVWYCYEKRKIEDGLFVRPSKCQEKPNNVMKPLD